MHLQREIERLKQRFLEIVSLVENNLSRAVKSFLEKDATLAREVIGSDHKIDQKEVDLEEECLKALALHQPVAVDLRFIVAVLKINNDLERVGDLAVNIAENAIWIAARFPGSTFDLERMAEKTKRMLKLSVVAFLNMDPNLSREVTKEDDEIDVLDRETRQSAVTEIHEHPDQVDFLLRVLDTSRRLERIADHATNIAEDVIYLAEGRIVRHKLGELGAVDH
jgi:phosphate transport system protein